MDVYHPPKEAGVNNHDRKVAKQLQEALKAQDKVERQGVKPIPKPVDIFVDKKGIYVNETV